MKIFFVVLMSLVLGGLAVAGTQEYSVDCQKDSECVLFIDECRNLLSVNISFLKSDHVEYFSDQKTQMYTWKSAYKGCDMNLFVHPAWPFKPKAICRKKKCEVVSGEK